MCSKANGAGDDLHNAQDDPLSDERLKRLAPDLFDDTSKRDSLLQLRDLQREFDAAYTDYVRQRVQLEQTFLRGVQPLLQRRKSTVSDADLSNFWSVVFENCDTLSENITAKDALALRYLEDVSCETATQQHEWGAEPWTPGSFKLHFDFAPNPFFENRRLSKTYIMCSEDPEHAADTRGCKIKWKACKDLTTKTLRRKTQSGKTLVRKQKTDSFFNFFEPPTLNCALDDERAAEIEEVLDADFEIAECIKEDVIPRALLYFLDVARSGECGSVDWGAAYGSNGDEDGEDEEEGGAQ